MADIITNEEYDLIAFMLDYLNEEDADYILLQNETENDFITENEDYFKDNDDDLKGMDKDMLFDFVSNNRKTWPLAKEKLKTATELKLLSRIDFEKAFDGDGTSATGWEAFYKKYEDSDGEMLVSRAGFNKNRTEALLYIAGLHDYLCAEGNLCHLKKENGKWQLSNIVWLWNA